MWWLLGITILCFTSLQTSSSTTILRIHSILALLRVDVRKATSNGRCAIFVEKVHLLVFTFIKCISISFFILLVSSAIWQIVSKAIKIQYIWNWKTSKYCCLFDKCTFYVLGNIIYSYTHVHLFISNKVIKK